MLMGLHCLSRIQMLEKQVAPCMQAHIGQYCLSHFLADMAAGAASRGSADRAIAECLQGGC